MTEITVGHALLAVVGAYAVIVGAVFAYSAIEARIFAWIDRRRAARAFRLRNLDRSDDQ